VEPTDGEIGILGRNISRDFNLVRHRIGYCPQHNCNFKSLNVYEHLKFYAWVKQLPSEMHDKLIDGVIKKLRLTDYKYKHADQLSGGNKRKLQTAIAILGNPLVVLLDEPSAGMDPAARRFMWKIVSGISKERKNTCCILTTHSMEEADALSSRMGILVHGGIFRCMGTSEHIKRKFGSGYESLFKMKMLE
jgi:ATP-binding cassette subfamily A (ABC1) protein 3